MKNKTKTKVNLAKVINNQKKNRIYLLLLRTRLKMMMM